MFSSELDRDMELIRGEVDGWDSGGPSEETEREKERAREHSHQTHSVGLIHITCSAVGKRTFLEMQPHILFLKKSAPA